jgi:hypothetical protein
MSRNRRSLELPLTEDCGLPRAPARTDSEPEARSKPSGQPSRMSLVIRDQVSRTAVKSPPPRRDVRGSHDKKAQCLCFPATFRPRPCCITTRVLRLCQVVAVIPKQQLRLAADKLDQARRVHPRPGRGCDMRRRHPPRLSHQVAPLPAPVGPVRRKRRVRRFGRNEIARPLMA